MLVLMRILRWQLKIRINCCPLYVSGQLMGAVRKKGHPLVMCSPTIKILLNRVFVWQHR
jgi:hypothetical protein